MSHTVSEVAQTLRALVASCHYRDAVMASNHADKLDLAVERYAHAISKARELLESLTDELVSGDGK